MSNIQLNKVYNHYKKEGDYIPLSFCLSQVNNQWIESIRYIKIDTPLEFIRSITEFQEKFKLKEN